MILPTTFDDPHSYRYGMGDTEAARLTLRRIRARTASARALRAYTDSTATRIATTGAAR